MFQTCIYCHKPLGANEAIEEFPVGRRIAFDAAKGRLWAVCRSCERWNLSPLDTRWEAIEACERAFSDTRLRVSTDNIGLARLKEGVELVRIGDPQRPEFAAWRYGDQFGRRRTRAFLIGGGAVAALGAVVVAGAAAGMSIGAFGGMWGNIPNMIRAARRVKLRTDDGRIIKANGVDLAKARFMGSPLTGEPVLSLKIGRRIERFEGEEALRVAARVLPAINMAGGRKRTVAQAVQEIESQRGSEAYLARYLRRSGPLDLEGEWEPFSKLPAPTRLALEMTLHEESERRAIEGELAVLEAAWQEAEEIANIADNMLLPARIESRLKEMKRGG